MIDNTVSRRMFIGGGVAAAGMLSAMGATFRPALALADDPEWAVPQTTDIAEVITADVAVIGGGFSGMTCAVQAALNGDRVALIESQGKLGGGGMALEITCGVGSQLSAANGIDYEPWELVRAEMENAAWCADGMLWLDLITNSGANIDWLVEQGVEYEPVVDEYRIMQFSGAYKVAHWYKDGYAGSGYVPQMTERIEGLDIDVFTNTRAYEFVCDESGKVTGVLCSDVNGETVQVNAHVFIVATGSFAQNEELLEEEGFRPAEIDILAMPGHFGDGIRMVRAVGGTFFKGGTALIYNRIGQLWTFADLNGSVCSGGPFLWVNEEGLRYTDENIALEKKLCPLEAVQTQIHKSCYTVFDANIFSQVTGGDEGLAQEWADAIVENPDDIFVSDDLYALADMAGIDAEQFANTVDAYNACCAAGKDSDFGKDPATLVAIENGPFYLAKMHIAMEGSLYGVNIDHNFNVVDSDRVAIPNLFCIGLDSMSLYKSVYPMSVPGSASAECIHGGRTAANRAHAYIEANGLFGVEPSGPIAGNLADGQEARSLGAAFIRKAESVMNKNDLGLDGGTPQTVTSESCPELFERVGKIMGVDVESCTLECDVSTIVSETVRGNHETYTYLVTYMDAVIDGVEVIYENGTYSIA